MKSFDQFNYSNSDLPESENLDEESLEELFGQIRKAGKLISRMARSSNSGQGTGPKQLELPLGDKNTKGKLSPIPKQSSMQPKPRSLKVIGNKVGNFLTKPGVRMAGSAINQGAKAFKREFAAQPKISSTAPGTGFGAPFGGVMGAAGAGIKGAVTKGQTFDKNTTDKDGNRQLGKKAGSILSRARSSVSRNVFGATPVRDQNKEKKDGKVPVTGDVEKKKPRSQTPDSASRTRSPQATGKDRPTGDVAKSRSPEQMSYVKLADNILGKDKKKQREVDKVLQVDPKGNKPVPDDIAKQMAEYDRENTGTSNTSNTSTQQGPKMKRPNISNQRYRNNPELYKQDKEAYNAQSAEFKTKVGNQGRPPKPVDKLDLARKSGAMAAAQKKNPIRIKRGTKEVMQDQYSWREEFIWETEKIPSKKKDGRGMHPHGEIKPMSGKNNVIINPEDETAKYKRGY